MSSLPSCSRLATCLTKNSLFFIFKMALRIRPRQNSINGGFLSGCWRVALELGRNSIKRLLLLTVVYPVMAISYEACASRLWWLLLVLRFALPAFVVKWLFLPPIIAVVAFVIATLSLTFALVRPFIFGLGVVLSERFHNGDGVVKCLNTPPIEFYLGNKRGSLCRTCCWSRAWG